MSDLHLKSEPMETSVIDFDPVQLESEILQLCLQYPNGVSHKIVQNSFPNITPEQCLQIINRLSSARKIDILKSSTEPGTFFYRIQDPKNTAHSSITIGNGSIDEMERSVYQIVKESGNLGIWMRDIRVKTQLPPTLLNKTLKALESKKLIKAVKSVHANKRKVRDYSIRKFEYDFLGLYVV
jgi:DNA-directed RNA polymerase III subunit RPC6